ncbi:hypothetical protein [Actinophytocola sp.]|uniref:hypothetical protein n=1 Tax=Actinophytocola sp. TaxID=1872138 RepID=UPI003D6BD37B
MDQDEQRLDGSAAPQARRAAALRAGLLRHWLIITLLVAGTVLRVLAWVAYQPALLFGDSFRYLDYVGEYPPNGLHPIGYSLFVLGPVLAVGGLELVTAIQHVAVLAAAVASYALALRLGVRRWLAALAAAPLLLDAYELQIEQMIMADAWQQVLLVALLWVLIGRGAPSPRRAALGGLLLGVALVFKLIVGALVIPALCYLVIAGGAWRAWRENWRIIAARSLAFLAGFAVVVVSYGAYFTVSTGQVGLSHTTGNVLYGRAAVVADCDTLELSPLLRNACPKEPRSQRHPDRYAHRGADAKWRDSFPPGTDIREVQRSFAWAVVRQQPLNVLGGITEDFLKGFRPVREDAPGDVTVLRWHFTEGYQYYNHPQTSTEYTERFSGRAPSDVPSLGLFLRTYQLSVGYTPGTLLGIFGIVALLAGFGLGRARRSGIRSAALLTAGMALTILLASAAFEFSWRYQLPGLVLLPLAGVLGLTALLERRRAHLTQPAGSRSGRSR